MVGKVDTAKIYKNPKLIAEYEETKLYRVIQGEPDERGLLFSEWSSIGRLGLRFTFDEEPFYIMNRDELDKPKKYRHMEIFNHRTSQQNDIDCERLNIIAKYKGYDEAILPLQAN